MRYSPLLCCAAILGCATYAPAPFAPDQHAAAWNGRTVQAGPTLRLTDAETLALIGHPDLRIARAKLKGTRAHADLAGLLADPSLDIGAGRILSGSTSPWMVEGGLGFTLPLSNRLSVERELAERALSAQTAETLAMECRVIRELRGGFAAWQAAETRERILTLHATRLGELHTRVARLVLSGTVADYEADALAFALAKTEADMAEAAADTRRERLRILALCGLRPEAPITLIAETATPADSAAPLPVHPLRAAAEMNFSAAESALHLEIERSRPELALGPSGKREDGATTLGLGLGLSLPLWNRNRQAIAEATANREVARVTLETTIENLAHARAQAESECESATERYRVLTEKSLPLLLHQTQAVTHLIDAGELDPIRLADLLDRRLELELTLATAEGRLGQASAELRYFTHPLPVSRPTQEASQ